MSSGSNRSNILIDASPKFRVYKDGRVERLQVPAYVPPSLDPQTGVESKDVKIFPEPETGIFVRLYKPKLPQNHKKIPLLVYFHGECFTQSTFTPVFHNYLNMLASQTQSIVASVEYRLLSEKPFPTLFSDCWYALNWAISHAQMTIGSDHKYGYTSTSIRKMEVMEPWLVDNVDFSRIFLAGDSAGANIAHQMAMKVGQEGFTSGLSLRISGMIMFHPMFWGKERIGNEEAKLNDMVLGLLDMVWPLIYPGKNGMDDPWINPAQDPSLSRLACHRVLIVVSDEDTLRDRGFYYKEVLEKSGWQGKAEVVDYKGEPHVFHLRNPSCANALDAMSKVVAFINSAPASIEKTCRSRL